jgi:hypothetical protein
MESSVPADLRWRRSQLARQATVCGGTNPKKLGLKRLFAVDKQPDTHYPCFDHLAL